MQSTTHANTIAVSHSLDLWQLNKDGQTLAVIERAWDDRNWLVFLADASGQLVFHGAYGRIATLKTCLRIWARRNAGRVAPFFHADPRPE